MIDREAVLSAAVIAAVLLAMVGVCGCGASALERHVTAAKVSRSLLDGAAGALEAACDPDDVEARPDAPERARRCLAAAESHDVARAVWVSYAEALVLAAEGDDLDLPALLPLGLRLLSAYGEVAEAARFFGVELPPLPSLLGGAS